MAAACAKAPANRAWTVLALRQMDSRKLPVEELVRAVEKVARSAQVLAERLHRADGNTTCAHRVRRTVGDDDARLCRVAPASTHFARRAIRLRIAWPRRSSQRVTTL